MNMIRVNPATRGGQVLTVLDDRGQVIVYRPGGQLVPESTFYRRLLSAHDLILVMPESKKELPQAEPDTGPAEVETKTKKQKTKNKE